MELSIPALYKINQPYREIIDQYTNPCPLIAGHALGTISALLLDLLSCLTTLRSRWQSYSDTITTHQTRNFRPLLYSGMPGRPRFDVSRDEIEYLRSLFFSWSEIAALIGISRSTLYRYIKMYLSILIILYSTGVGWS